ncbi:hypothetical protein SipoB123_32390 [Streptomyces ipomoeae]|nr:hypothetical protein SipoB123_32390 [Streptomyces ipomoeae]
MRWTARHERSRRPGCPRCCDRPLAGHPELSGGPVPRKGRGELRERPRRTRTRQRRSTPTANPPSATPHWSRRGHDHGVDTAGALAAPRYAA